MFGFCFTVFHTQGKQMLVLMLVLLSFLVGSGTAEGIILLVSRSKEIADKQQFIYRMSVFFILLSFTHTIQCILKHPEREGFISIIYCGTIGGFVVMYLARKKDAD